MIQARAHLDLMVGEDAIADLAEWAEMRAAEFGAEAEPAVMARLCVEEAVTNIVRHGCSGDPDGHTICAEISRDDMSLQLTIIDDCRPFDPTTVPEHDGETTILAASIGGRGIRLMRRLSQQIIYERRDGRNRLTIIILLN